MLYTVPDLVLRVVIVYCELQIDGISNVK